MSPISVKCPACEGKISSCGNCDGLGKIDGVVCPVCKGKPPQCDECDGQGEIDIDRCPLLVIAPDVWEVLKYAGLYEKGLPPVAGGALDQSDWFLSAAEYIFEQEQRLKNQQGIF